MSCWTNPPSGKRCNYMHYLEDGGPNHFCKVIMARKLEAIPMPQDFTKALPDSFSWRGTIWLMNGRVTLDQGWATFHAFHRIKIGYTVTFKFPTPCTLNIIVFNHDGIEVITKCMRHDDAFTVSV
ncbi:Cohesin subunit SA-1 [Hordeum vulgare]|nr:Cohesin subunit SA-1 [Hordeum vulgare]